MFDCTICKKTFKYNYQLNKHINRKYPCEAIKHQNEYLYIIQTADCIQKNNNIFKVGRSKQYIGSDGNSKRLEQYPKGSTQLALFTVNNCIAAEAHMKEQLLNSQLKNMREYGFEYFQGSLQSIISIIAHTVDLFKPSNNQLRDEHIKLSPDEYLKSQLTSRFQCVYCNKVCTRQFNLDQHKKSCKEKHDDVRCLEMKLYIQYPCDISHTQCRFCNLILNQTSALTRHVIQCKAKKEYRRKLESELKT